MLMFFETPDAFARLQAQFPNVDIAGDVLVYPAIVFLVILTSNDGTESPMLIPVHGSNFVDVLAAVQNYMQGELDRAQKESGTAGAGGADTQDTNTIIA